MTTTTLTAPATRVDALLLVRLLPPAKRPLAPSRLRRELERLLPEPLEDDEWRATLARLREQGKLAPRGCQLTDAGRAAVLEFLGLSEPPPRTDWRALKSKYLFPKALGLQATEQTHKLLGKQDQVAALILKREHQLPLGPGATLPAVLEALVCRELGYPSATTLREVREAKLAEMGAGPDLARRVLGAEQTKGGLDGLRDAVLRGWLREERGPAAATPEPREEERTFDLTAFARTALAAARASATGRFGDNKVFINHAWRQWAAEPGVPPMDLDTFKARLVEANREGLLTLSRADLVQAMNAEDVRESETHYLNGSYHFVLLEEPRA